MKICEGLFHPLLEIGMEDICKLTGVDIHSKKLKLLEHVKLLTSYVVLQCISSRELAGDLLFVFLVDISASQLSKVNDSRDYTVFVMVFYALLCHPSNYREQWRIRRFLGKKILGIDSTQISLKQMLKLPEGVYPLREKESKGIKFMLQHFSAPWFNHYLLLSHQVMSMIALNLMNYLQMRACLKNWTNLF